MRVAVDAMGGDQRPAAPVEGALRAVAARKDLEVLLVGPRATVEAALAAAPPGAGRDRVRVVDAPDVIETGESPARAVLSKRQSSIVVGLELCGRGEADAFVSAGNTGALTAGSVLIWKTIPGVDRPAMPAVLPTVDGRGCVFLDVGAGTEAGPDNLCDFAIMGSLYAERARGIREPRVALLNVGTEERKGTAVAKEAFARLQAARVRFVGNVEGRDLFADRADVVVTDGFVGNVVLKTIEGMGIGLSQVLGRELRHSGFITLLGAALAARTLRGMRRRLDYAEVGGVPFLGVRGVCVKCHGSSGARALGNGVLSAAAVVGGGVVAEIERALRGLPGAGDAAPAEGATAGA
jgi:glycerol-3-phosphate acyltransferase PlsX